MALLQAKNVTKYFGENCVLNDVSIDIEKGSFVSIIGASGSGKSTLLTILGGIDKPTQGTVTLDGEEISAMSEKQLAILRRSKLGFVFQFFNLAPYLTAEENVLLPIMLSGKVTDEHRARAKELMEYLGVAEQKDKLPQKMSGGEQQRVAIARGLIINPEVILLDEPTGNLDSRNSAEIMNLLKRINEEMGTTIVQVTHSDLNAQYGDRIIAIKDGKILDVVEASNNDKAPVELITETQIETNEEV
ncbi:MAG: ABC transporter ATP-binding protein [Clostridia bacterium]|nr:ABC transporter ATP-binding protein [Clostridia bacterium]